ncbi:MAG: hypothetical protein M1515_02435 [Candidatus Thermoplasmatota archaeon]|jgi:hypothetical protein|nr:hypothetical protein [Candidatus Thermoplasmatota archaeon]
MVAPNGGIFVTVMLLIMGLSLLVLGIFAAYFGSGKVRSFGAGLAVAGIVIGIITYLIRRPLGIVGTYNMEYVIYNGLLYLISAIIGAVIALLIFLAVLLKS